MGKSRQRQFLRLASETKPGKEGTGSAHNLTILFKHNSTYWL